MRYLRLCLHTDVGVGFANIIKVYSLDEYRFGMNALWWYNRTGEEKYKIAADDIRGMLDRHPRTPSGGVSIFFSSQKVKLLN